MRGKDPGGKEKEKPLEKGKEERFKREKTQEKGEEVGKVGKKGPKEGNKDKEKLICSGEEGGNKSRERRQEMNL